MKTVFQPLSFVPALASALTPLLGFASLLTLLLSITAPALAAKKPDKPVVCEGISVQIPDDWVVVQPPVRGPASCNMSFGKKNQSASLSISIGKADGPRADEVALSVASQIGSQTRPIYEDDMYRILFEDDGVPGECVVGDHGVLFAVTCMFGDIETARNFIRNNVKSAQPSLLPK